MVTLSNERGATVRGITQVLAALDDVRAVAVLATMPARGGWDLDALEAALRAPDRQGDALRALASLLPPPPDRVSATLDTLLAAVREVEDTRHAEADERAAEVVRAALTWHDAHGAGPCPLCGTGQLGAGWRRWAQLWLAEQRVSAERATSARARLAEAEADARRLIRPVEVPAGTGLDTSALAAAVARVAAAEPLEGRSLLAALEERLAALAAEIAAIAGAARARLVERWAPVARVLAALLAEGRRSEPIDPLGRAARSAALGVPGPDRS